MAIHKLVTFHTWLSPGVSYKSWLVMVLSRVYPVGCTHHQRIRDEGMPNACYTALSPPWAKLDKETYRHGTSAPFQDSSLLPSPPGQYRLDGSLIGVGVIDLCPRALSSVYFFHEPALRSHPLSFFPSSLPSPSAESPDRIPDAIHSHGLNVM